MQALKITFRFSAPVLRDSEQPLHLDALIASAVMREYEALDDSEDAWRAADDLSAILDRTEGENWVWKASQLMFAPALPVQWFNQIRKCDPEAWYDDLGHAWVGRFNTHELGVNPETFSINYRSGQYRGYQWLNSIQWMDSAQAWAVGDRDAIEHYLGQISHIGKKSANGFGRLFKTEDFPGFSIEEASQNELDNWMLRTLPAGHAGKSGIQYEPVFQCLRAPYWRKLDREMALEPLI